MVQFKVINRLQLRDGVLMCKKPSGRSWQKAHYKQGDLDGACGAYSVAMVLNILQKKFVLIILLIKEHLSGN